MNLQLLACSSTLGIPAQEQSWTRMPYEPHFLPKYNKDHFPSLTLSRLHAVQSDYGKELKFIHLKHCILFSSNGIFICILFSLMKMEMNSLAHPVIALFQQQRRLDQSVPFPHSHQGKLSACLLAAFGMFSETN